MKAFTIIPWKYKYIHIVVLVFLIMSVNLSTAQNVCISASGATPDASAMLDVQSTSKGFLVPRMTAAQKNAIASPATGLLVFQTDAPAGYYYYNGTSWTMVGGAGWSLTGNSGTTAPTTSSPMNNNFLGTTDARDLAFATNNAERLRILSGGNVGIGTTSPSSLLSVGGSSQFQVNSTGNIVKINNVTYSWPSSQGSLSSSLVNDGSGNLTWASAGWARVAYVSLTNATSYVLAGLNGDVDIAYTIVLIGSHATGGSSRTCYIQPNSDGTAANYATSVDGYAVSASANNWMNSSYGGAGMLIWVTDGAATNRTTAETILNAVSGQERHCVTRYSLNTSAGNMYIDLSAGGWKNTATNITSINFVWGGTGFTGKLIVYALR